MKERGCIWPQTARERISRVRGFRLEGLEKGEEVGMALCVQLLLVLELTLQSQEVGPELLIRRR